MLIKNIEQKIKINKMVSLVAIVFAVFMVISGFFFSYKMIQDSRKSIYILDNGIPVLAKQTDVLLNRLLSTNPRLNCSTVCFSRLHPMMPTLKKMYKNHCIS